MFSFNIYNPVILLAIAILIRWLVAQFSYSGFDNPPMYGDYEAQRHWMEITTNLPIDQWYKNSTDNDLSYWGLDYPPLTAYHMYLVGRISKEINSTWTDLHQSRGTESLEHKLFMRYTVIVADLVLYLSTIIYYFRYTQPSHYDSPPSNSHKQNTAIYTALVLLYPAQILIDHGHFQYNCVFMGLVLMAIILVINNQLAMASILYTLSIGYKQMSLYYSLPFFWYIASICFRQGSFLKILRKFILFAIIVSTTMGLIFSPYLRNLDDLLQVLNRVFPVSRGLFEDKVANIWFCLNIPLKLKANYSTEHLLKLSTLSTLVASLPTGIHLLFRPSVRSFKYALVNSSMIFFLISFQVHEKTILVPALPMLLLFREHPMVVNWFVLISTFSLQPLLMRDGLSIPYHVLIFTYVIISWEIFWRQRSFDLNKLISIRNLLITTYIISILGMITLDAAALFVKPPSRYPDIHPTANALYSCIHYVIFLLFFHYQQFRNPSKMINPTDQSSMQKKNK